MRLKQSISNKQKFSQTLKNWFPILKANISELEKDLKEYAQENPFVEIKSGFEEVDNKKYFKREFLNTVSNSRSDAIEALTIEEESIYDILYNQIIPPLFPTKISQEIALEIINYLDDSGYFTGDIEQMCKKLDTSPQQIEKIRARFAHIEPIGIGATDFKESFLFQLDNMDIDDELYTITQTVIKDFDNLIEYVKHPRYQDIKNTIKTFRNPPINDITKDDDRVIPDIFIYHDIDGNIEIKLNDDFYPDIIIDEYAIDDNEFVKNKIKEAKNLVDALNMRKSTLYKVGLEIIENQYEYFNGGKLRPMKLQDIADALEHNSSTISRAIANKYIECNRGIIPTKEFFTTAIDEDTSNSSLKDYLIKLIKEENRQKPLSDIKIVEQIQKKFDIKLGRRTVTKYRLQLNIESSGERKNAYRLIDI